MAGKDYPSDQNFKDIGKDRVNSLKDCKGRAALHIAAKDNNLPEVVRLLSLGAEVDIRDQGKLTPLITAANFNEGDSHFGVVKELLMHGADVNTVDHWSRTPLHCLAKTGNAKIVELLLKFKAGVDIKSKCTDVALATAVCNCNVGIIQVLIDYGSDVNSADKNGATPLYKAADRSKKDEGKKMIEILLKNGANVNAQTNSGLTPLHSVLGKADIETIKLLLKSGADCNLKNNSGSIPLVYAYSCRNMDLLQLLMDYGSDINSTDSDGATPLHKAADRFNDEKTAEFLLEHGANTNMQTIRSGCTPLHLAARRARTKIMQLLFKHNANVNLKNNNGENPLFEAVGAGNVEAVQLLLDQGSDVENINLNGSTLLHKVAQSCSDKNNMYYKVAELLLKRGLDVNAQDQFDKTPLHYLIKEANIRIIQLFLKNKADVNVKDQEGKIPLFYAENSRETKLLELLVDFGSDITSIHISNGSSLLHWACLYCKIATIKNLLINGEDLNALDKKEHTPLMRLLIKSNNYDYNLKELKMKLMFLLEYSDINFVKSSGKNILQYCKDKDVAGVILAHIAMLQELNVPLDPSILETISSRDNYQDYYQKCKKELAKTKNKFSQSWVSFFNLLTDSNRKLKNYCGNHSLIQEFKKSDSKNKFPIYGALIQENVAKGMNRRKAYDSSAGVLSNLLPIFGPSHLIIRNTLDCLTLYDYVKLTQLN